MVDKLFSYKRLKIITLAVVFALSYVTVFSGPLRAYDEAFYSSNNILFYDPRSKCEAGSGGTAGAILSGDSIEEKVWNFFVQKGLTAEQTAGVMGNISHESGFRPDAIEGGNSIGFGLVQWSFGRRTALEQAAAQAGKNPSDLGFQLEYLYTELTSRGVNYSKYQGKGYANEWDGLSKQATVNDATIFFHHEFEVSYLINYDRPGYRAPFHNRTYASADAAVIGERGGLEGPTGHPGAQHYFDTYSGSTGGGGGGGSCEDEAANGKFDINKLYEDSTAIACATGTTDRGVTTAYINGKSFNIKVCEVTNSLEEGKNRGALVNSLVSGAVYEMFKKMSTDLKLDRIPITSSFKTMDEQQASWDANSSSQATRPGYSNHQSGAAIDFGGGGCDYKSGVTSCPNNTVYKWLTENAAAYQYQQLKAEWWHWSPNGQ